MLYLCCKYSFAHEVICWHHEKKFLPFPYLPSAVTLCPPGYFLIFTFIYPSVLFAGIMGTINMYPLLLTCALVCLTKARGVGGEYDMLQKVGSLRHHHLHCPWYFFRGFSIDIYIILFYCTLTWFMEVVKLTPVIAYDLGGTRFLIEQK